MDTTKKSQTILSLCSGYGGLEIGLERVFGKVSVLAYVEIEAYAIANLVDKMESDEMVPAPVWTDIKTFRGKEFLGKVDVVTAGFPCQPFSDAGKKQGTSDERHLWPYIEKLIGKIKPTCVFLENVPGIISTKTIIHRPKFVEYCIRSAQRLGEYWGSIIHARLCRNAGISVLQYVLWRLEIMGYKCEAGLFSAAEVGAPHQRKRVFILGRSDQPGLEGRNGGSLRERIDEQIARKGSASSMGYSESNDERRLSVPAVHREREQVRGSSGEQWPARPGQEQFEWEEPRIC